MSALEEGRQGLWKGDLPEGQLMEAIVEMDVPLIFPHKKTDAPKPFGDTDRYLVRLGVVAKDLRREPRPKDIRRCGLDPCRHPCKDGGV